MIRFEAVLFDWMMTLAHYPSPAEHLEIAHDRLGRQVDAAQIDQLVIQLAVARDSPEVQAAAAIEDTSAEAHHIAEHLAYETAGIEAELATELYRLLGTPEFHPPYPDASAVVEHLARRDLKIGVVSDIHVDLRHHAAEFGFGDSISAWALSCELGIQKPDPRIFYHALGELGVDPACTLMVGDRPSRDGAAADLGMPCLILPALEAVGERGLQTVVDLVTGQR